jgi:DNA-binding response OmpR family regulator
MLSDPLQVFHCPRCLDGDVQLSRPHTAWDFILLPAPIRCRSCAARFHKHVDLTQLPERAAAGRSDWSVPAVGPILEPRPPAVLIVDDLIPFTTVVRETFVRRGFAVFGAKSPDEGLAVFQAHQPQIGLAVVGLVTPAAVNLDLAADLDHLQPGLPVLYLVGAGKSIARCSIEAQAPASVLAVPFTEEQLLARVGGLLNVEVAARQGRDKRLWDRLIAGSDWFPSGTAMLHVYGLQHAALAAGHMAMLSAGNIHHALQPTNCEAAPYSINVRAQDVTRARFLIGQASVGGLFVAA